MKESSSLKSRPITGILTVAIVICGGLLSIAEADEELNAASTNKISLVDSIDPTRVLHVDYSLQIDGTLITPGPGGTSSWKLASSGTFSFDQRRFPFDAAGPLAIRAARSFRTAQTETTVGDQRSTTVALPRTAHNIVLYGAVEQLLQLSPDVRLTRPQLDLLQIPCDPIVAAELLPARNLKDQNEKWNADTWVVPMLVGIDATISESATCRLQSLSDTEAVVEFEGQAKGAVTGSSTKVTLTGELTFDRTRHFIRTLKAVQSEKREAGPFSPGLDVTAKIEWTQRLVDEKDPAADSAVAESMREQLPDEGQLLLTLATPWRVLMLHNRKWHVFHETPEMVMLRMLHEGALVAQCNLAPAATVRAGDATSEQEYLAEIQEALEERKGLVKSSKIHPDINGWRVHHVRAVGKANSKALIWDYFLCTAKTGEQISLIFSFAEEDQNLVAGSPEQMLGTLTLRPARPKVALPR